MRKIFGIVLLFVQLVPVFSQTPEQVEQMRTAVLQKVQVFTLCLERIGDKSESIDYRSYFMNAALKMFIGQGNAFTEKRLDVSGKEVLIDHGGVNVQIAYDNKPPKRLLVKNTYKV